ncbi:MAG: nicotinate (nicotinamide) nucleotide adenylyltransferase [Oscillospiraceae bacterium]|nr:nicotinate (nicotinamide) nucleotide adenylyltransferase [Oscillospiraceae bacterium]
MKIAIYGGSFNPPHLGHAEAARTVYEELRPDIFLIVPDNIPPHKEQDENSPTAAQRLELCRLAFADIPGAVVSDIETSREGKSYTADTVSILRERYPEDELLLVIGTDMLLCFDEWYRFEYLLSECTLVVLPRDDFHERELREKIRKLEAEHAARITLLSHTPLEMNSSEIRERLKLRLRAGLLDDRVYSLIIREGWYDALPELSWLREKAYAFLEPQRIAHVVGCESEAVMLAKTWGEDPDTAATAGILHDITKKYRGEEQLNLCRKYGIVYDMAEAENPVILHARTGAAMARELFHVSEEIRNAIRWHTTGKPDMTTLEKILYLADFIEPTRDFPGLDELRELAYKDLDAAMGLALSLSMGDIRRRGHEVYKDTLDAYRWYCEERD